MHHEQQDTPAFIELGAVAELTQGSAIGVLDVGAGEKLPFAGLSDD